MGVICCLETWSVPVSGAHLGRVGICQWLYSGCTVLYCTVQCAGYSQGSVSSPSLRSDSAVSWAGVTREKSLAELMWMETYVFDLVVMADKCDLGLVKKKAALTFVSWLWASQVSAQPGHSPPARLKLSNGLEKGNWKWLRKTLREKLSSEFPMSQSQDAEYPEN